MSDDRQLPGPLVLAGSDAWVGEEGAADGIVPPGSTVVVLPTAAAYERPARLLGELSSALSALGARLEACMVLRRADAEDRQLAAHLRRARLIYLGGGSPLHLRSVLKDSTALAALLAAWHDGAGLIAAGAAAMVLPDPMVDPRGGAFSVGLGVVQQMAVVAGADAGGSAQLERTLALAPSGCAVVRLPASAAVVRLGDGTWRSAPALAGVQVFVDGEEGGLAALAGKSTA